MKKSLLTTFALLSALAIFPLLSQAQCNVSDNVSQSPKMLLLLGGQEKIFENKDLEDGVQMLYARPSLTTLKDDKNRIIFSIEFSYAASGEKPQIVPRQAKFHFKTDAPELLLIAEKHETENMGGFAVERCVFRVLPKDAALIKDNPIRGLTLIDNRTGEKVFLPIYASLFQEQFQCLLNKLKYL